MPGASASLDDAVRRIAALVPTDPPTTRRWIIAIAGPPASGKSTIAEALGHRLGLAAAVVGLDGFHLDDAVLAERGHRDRKGAPHTFDVDGYAATLRRLRDEPNGTIAVPVFDRGLELSRAAARVVLPHHRIVITEGNWLLLDRTPWTALRPLFDTAVFLTASQSTIRERILARWRHHGFDEQQALHRADHNDLPNAELARQASSGFDVTITTT